MARKYIDSGSRDPSHTSEIRRLILFFVGGLAIVTLALLLVNPTGSTSDRTGTGTVVLPQGGDQTAPEGRITEISPWRPDLERLNGILEDETVRGRVSLYPAVLKELADLVRNRPHYHFKYDPEKADVGGYELVDPKKLQKPSLDELNELRARPIEVVGVLKSKRLVPIADHDLDPKLYPPAIVEGVIETTDGVRVKFLQVRRAPDDQAIRVPLVGSKYKVMGVFYRLLDEGDGAFKGPFVLAKRVVEAVPLELREELPKELAESIRVTEETALARRPHEEQEFFDLVGWILKKGKAAIPEGIPVTPLNGHGPRDKPNDFRLKPVSVEGMLVYLAWESFEREDMRKEDAPILGYWHGIVSDKDPDVNVPVSILIPQRDVPEELQEWAYASPKTRRTMGLPWVALDGIYYRVHAYDARSDRKGKQTVHLPMVVAVVIGSSDMGRDF